MAKEDSRLVSRDGPCDSHGLTGLPKLFSVGMGRIAGHGPDSSETREPAQWDLRSHARMLCDPEETKVQRGAGPTPSQQEAGAGGRDSSDLLLTVPHSACHSWRSS